MAKPRHSTKKQGTDAPIDWAGLAFGIRTYAPGDVIFAQGDAAASVLFLETGTAKLSVVSPAGREAVVCLLAAGTFLGEGCLAGQPRRMATAAAVEACRVRGIGLEVMRQHLAQSAAFAQVFLTHMLRRNIRVEEDLVDQLFNSSEKRLARTLLLLARYGMASADHRVIPKLSQDVLAEMVGTTRSRVNAFMNKFRRLGFIEGNGELTIHPSLLTIVLHD